MLEGRVHPLSARWQSAVERGVLRRRHRDLHMWEHGTSRRTTPTPASGRQPIACPTGSDFCFSAGARYLALMSSGFGALLADGERLVARWSTLPTGSIRLGWMSPEWLQHYEGDSNKHLEVP